MSWTGIQSVIPGLMSGHSAPSLDNKLDPLPVSKGASGGHPRGGASRPRPARGGSCLVASSIVCTHPYYARMRAPHGSAPPNLQGKVKMIVRDKINYCEFLDYAISVGY